MDKDLKKTVKAFRDQGFTVEVSNRAHVIVRKGGTFVTAFAGTGSDTRGMRNGVADASRFGFYRPPGR
jgi:hypothetical protein